jgi:hypothetical protein
MFSVAVLEAARLALPGHFLRPQKLTWAKAVPNEVMVFSCELTVITNKS